MKKFLLYLLGTFLLIQLIQSEKSNPVVDKTKEIKATKEIMALFKRSCYDCHSNETKWPLYSYIAPFSWVVSSNVKNARRAMNFSSWKDIDDKIKESRVKRMKQLINNSMMPKGSYLMMHKKAVLSKKDKITLSEWVNKELVEKN